MQKNVLQEFTRFSPNKLYGDLIFLQKTRQNYARTVLPNKTDRNFVQDYAEIIMQGIICIELLFIIAEFDTVISGLLE